MPFRSFLLSQSYNKVSWDAVMKSPDRSTYDLWWPPVNLSIVELLRQCFWLCLLMMLLGTVSGTFRLFSVSAQQREEWEPDSALIALSTGLVSSDVRIKSISVSFPLSPLLFTLTLEQQLFPHVVNKPFFFAKGVCVVGKICTHFWLAEWLGFLDFVIRNKTFADFMVIIRNLIPNRRKSDHIRDQRHIMKLICKHECHANQLYTASSNVVFKQTNKACASTVQNALLTNCFKIHRSSIKTMWVCAYIWLDKHNAHVQG